jgi:hypothetical protein
MPLFCSINQASCDKPVVESERAAMSLELFHQFLDLLAQDLLPLDDIYKKIRTNYAG